MLAPVACLGSLLIHPRVGIVNVLAPVVDGAGHIGDKVADSLESLGRVDALVNAIVEEVHKEIIAVRIGRLCYVGLRDGRGLAAVEVDLDIPIALVGLGVLEPVANKCCQLSLVELVGIQAGGVECLVLYRKVRKVNHPKSIIS